MLGAIGIMNDLGVEVDVIHVLEHDIAFGMVTDATEHVRARDDWPALQRRIMDADILVLGTPIWLGEAGPGASSWNLLHLARRLSRSGR